LLKRAHPSCLGRQTDFRGASGVTGAVPDDLLSQLAYGRACPIFEHGNAGLKTGQFKAHHIQTSLQALLSASRALQQALHAASTALYKHMEVDAAEAAVKEHMQ